MQPDRGEPTSQLIREALEETRELARVEIALARDEVQTELAHAKRSAIASFGAAAAALVSLVMFMVTLALAFSTPRSAALLIALAFLCVAIGLGLAGYARIPGRPLSQTRTRLETNLKQLKERAR